MFRKQGLPKQVSKGVLKAHMLEYFREIERTGEELIVTDHRKPVLKIVSLGRKTKTAKAVFKSYRHHIVYHEDLTTPTSDQWKEI